MDRAALAEFLRVKRESLRPEDVGLSAGPRRRVAGLRREEVARLAAMSVEYYTRLEQARGPQPSPTMLAAITRALRLALDERDHLHRLAGHPAPARPSASETVAPALQRVLDRLDDVPALIISELDETLVQNRLARALFGAREERTGPARSGAWRWFLEPETERAVYPPSQHEEHSRAVVANLRAVTGLRGPRSRAAALAEELRQASPEFAALWERQEVGKRFAEHKTVLHPEIGPIEVDCQVLFTQDNSQALLTLTAAPGTRDAERLRLLEMVATP